jgi:hypothetical protein
MRAAVLALVVLAGCFHRPSLTDQARKLGNNVVAIGVKANAMVPDAVKDQIRAHVTAEVEARVVAAVPVPTAQPIEIHRSVVHQQSVATAPAPAPTVVIHHIDAAPQTFFGLQDGGRCTRFDTMDACTRACTALSQQRGMRSQANASCSCLEDAPGC